MHGVAVSSGIAIGQAHLVSHALLEVAHYHVPDVLVEAEVRRFSDAVTTVLKDLEGIRSSLPANAPAELGSFVGTHIMFLGDKSLSEVPKDIIRAENCNAEWALKQQMTWSSSSRNRR